MDCLVVAREPRLQRVLLGLLGGLGIQAKVVSDTEQALGLVGEKRFDAVVVDCCDFPNGSELIRSMRRMPANGKSVAFAILPQDSGAEMRALTEAHFILHQPLSIDIVTRSLRAARSLMLQEQRRYFRCTVQLPVNLSRSTEEVVVRTTNLSAGGMAIEPNEHLEASWNGKLRFQLPDGGDSIEALGEIAWMLPTKTAGIRFTRLSDRCRTALEQWVSARAAEDEPTSAR